MNRLKCAGGFGPLLSLLLASFISGCGGGGGSDDEMGVAPSITADNTSIAFVSSYESGRPASQLVRFRVSGADGNTPAFVFVDHTNRGIDTVYVLGPIDTVTDLEIVPRLPQDIGGGDTVSDTIQVRVCADRSCQREFNGSPIRISTTHAVEPYLELFESGRVDQRVVGDFDTHVVSAPIVIPGAGITWTAETDAPWLDLDRSAGQSPSEINLVVNHDALAIGGNEGVVTITDTQSRRQVTYNYSISLQLPSTSVSVIPLAFGGETGREHDAVSWSFAVHTGRFEHPWTMQIQYPDGQEPWLISDLSSATVRGQGQPLQLSPDLTVLDSGFHQAVMRITTNVSGYHIEIAELVTVALNRPVLTVSAESASFISTPDYELLERTLIVGDSVGTSGLTWEATTDAPWLEVTASGGQGAPLRLVANLDSIPVDDMVLSSVTLSADGYPSVTIPVSARRKTASPTDIAMPFEGFHDYEMDPLRPRVYVLLQTAPATVAVINTDNGDRLATYVADVAQPVVDISVEPSGAGLWLLNSEEMIRLDLPSGAEASRVAITNSSIYRPLRLLVPRVNGRRVALIGHLDGGQRNYSGLTAAYSVDTGERLSDFTVIAGAQIATSLDASRICGMNEGLSPFSAACARLDMQVHESMPVDFLDAAYVRHGVGGNGYDIAVSPDGSHAYTASGAPYEFPAYDTADMRELAPLPGEAYPNAVQVSTTGRIAGLADQRYWVYRPNGQLVTTGDLSATTAERGIQWSADSARICVAVDDFRLTPIRLECVNAYD